MRLFVFVYLPVINCACPSDLKKEKKNFSPCHVRFFSPPPRPPFSSSSLPSLPLPLLLSDARSSRLQFYNSGFYGPFYFHHLIAGAFADFLLLQLPHSFILSPLSFSFRQFSSPSAFASVSVSDILCSGFLILHPYSWSFYSFYPFPFYDYLITLFFSFSRLLLRSFLFAVVFPAFSLLYLFPFFSTFFLLPPSSHVLFISLFTFFFLSSFFL